MKIFKFITTFDTFKKKIYIYLLFLWLKNILFKF